MIRTLLFLPDDGRRWWLRLGVNDGAERGEGGAQRGDGWPEPLDPATPSETIAVVPGEQVALHWIELPPLAPAQTAAAVRLLAADVSATPLDATHVAIGSSRGDARRPLALVDNELMAGWLGELAAAGIDPDRIVPDTLLLLPPPNGVAVLADGYRWLVRGAERAFAAETDLARLLIGDAVITPVGSDDWGAQLPAALAMAGLDLRQGAFARPRRWRMDNSRLRRAALVALAIAGTLLAPSAVSYLRHDLAAANTERDLADTARAVLPRDTVIGDARAQVAARLDSLGGGSGFTALAVPLLAALRDRPGVSLDGLNYAGSTGLVAVLVAPDAGDRAAIAAGLEAAGVTARMGVPRDDGGRVLVDLVVLPR
jgi:general secretion pathway protein L